MRVEGKNKLVFPELSYRLIGVCFRVFNTLGWGFPEVHYQKALAKEFETASIRNRREVYIPILYKGNVISRTFVDFIVEDTIILELKVVRKLAYVHTRQLLTYLHASGIKLGILVYFTNDGVKYRRVLNSKA